MNFDTDRSLKKRKASPYRFAATPKYVVAGLVDLVGKARSPSVSRKNRSRNEQRIAASTKPVSSSQGLIQRDSETTVVSCTSIPPTPTSVGHRSVFETRKVSSPTTAATTLTDQSRSEEVVASSLNTVKTVTQDTINHNRNFAEKFSGYKAGNIGGSSHKQNSHFSSHCSQLASVSPIIRVQYSNENIAPLKTALEGKSQISIGNLLEVKGIEASDTFKLRNE
uniref:Uncharacterized protein n=1 Tax=Syphacia muris TaxID=451379 RepID=A0A0N5ABK5_9BILA